MKEENTSIKEANWQRYHVNLINLVNGDFPSVWLRILNEIWPKKAFFIAAKQLNFEASKKLDVTDATGQIEVVIPACQTENKSISSMNNWMDEHLDNDLYAIILHGSLGNNEVVNYSDFDALVIIKNEVFNEKKRLARVAHRLFQARRIMYSQDPLQHHGWFVLPEQALHAWPEAYLPVIVLENSSQIKLPGSQNLMLSLDLDTGREVEQFSQLANSIKQSIASGVFSANLYQFKSLISKILLLPALYVQARDRAGVFKRESFEMAKVDFQTTEWIAIEAASTIRTLWPIVEPPRPKFLSNRPGWIGNLWRRKRWQPVPDNLSCLFGKIEEQALLQLMDTMHTQLTRSGAGYG